MKKSVIALSVILGLVAMTSIALAEPVSVSVTPSVLAISVTDGSVDFGKVPYGGKQNTFNIASQEQIVANTGSVSANILLDATGSANWTLAATAGSEIFASQYFLSDGGTPTWTALTGTATDSTVDLAAGTDIDLNLKIDMPTDSVVITSQTYTVNVTATE